MRWKVKAVTPSWQEMRNRATRFTLRWRDETRERAEKDSFWNEFFAVFDIDRRRVAVFEHLSSRHSTGGRGFMDVFWPGYVAAEHKSRGSDLGAAMDQALDYLPTIPAEHLPRLVVVSDFGRFRVLNQLTGEQVEFPIADLSARLRVFAPMLDAEVQQYATEEDVNLKATELLGLLHDSLKASGYDGHPLRVLLVRLVFVLFADDTQVWEPGLFYDYLLVKSSVDGHDLGPALIHLFQVLNTPKKRRSQHLDDDLARFEYINGALFGEAIPIPDCTRGMRERLLKACRFDWSKISPAIFGSLFQNVMDGDERRTLGAHYTTEHNILKTIEPLFLDDLRTELEATRGLDALRRFHDRLASLNFFDPACGCGNFLIIAYRELRRLELVVLRRIRAEEARSGKDTARFRARGRLALVGEGQLGMDVTIESKVHVGQLFGIEIEEFPARIAETAVYLIDHLENLSLSAAFGEYYARFPITDSAHIRIGNALSIDWNDVLPAAECDYLFGNPPFVGALRLNAEQTEDRARTFIALPEAEGLRTGRLDYVMCWYARAFDYLRATSAAAAFVSTNSITQGEQARSFAPLLARTGFKIDFAHRTFAWQSEARGKAVVHVVIIGFSQQGRAGEKPLFDYPDVRKDPILTEAKNINAWLLDAEDVFIGKRVTPFVEGLPVMTVGSQPTDGGHLLIKPDQLDEVLADPVAAKYIYPLIGAEEMLSGKQRWCLWLVDAEPQDLRSSLLLRTRLEAVRALREASPTESFRRCPPHLFTHRKQPSTDWIAIPQHSSETRRIIPMAIYSADHVAHNSLMLIRGAPPWVFGLLQSSMFTTWCRVVCSRIKSEIRISADIAYNSFPFPDTDANSQARLAAAAEAVLPGPGRRTPARRWPTSTIRTRRRWTSSGRTKRSTRSWTPSSASARCRLRPSGQRDYSSDTPPSPAQERSRSQSTEAQPDYEEWKARRLFGLREVTSRSGSRGSITLP